MGSPVPALAAARPLLDVVMVRYRADEMLAASLRALTASSRFIAGVIVVDNGPTPLGKAGWPAGLDVTLVTPPANVGYGPGSNLGAKEGRAPFILFLNPDAVIEPPVIERALELLAAPEGPAVVGPRLVSPGGHTMPSAGRQPSLAWETYEKLAKKLHWALFERSVRDRRRLERVEWVAGACLFIRREVFEAIGGFDPAFFLYFEDKELCARVRERGHEVCFMWEPAAQHHGAGSGDSKLDADCFRAYRESQIHYYRKHRPAAEQAVLRAYLRARAALMRPFRPRLAGILKEIVNRRGRA